MEPSTQDDGPVSSARRIAVAGRVGARICDRLVGDPAHASAVGA